MAEELARLRSITSTALLAEFALGRGLEPSVILRHTGIREADLHDAMAEVTVGQEITVMRNIVHAIGDEPGLGLLAGMNCRAAGLGVLGFALMNSPTLGHMLDVVLRYIDLAFNLAPCHLRRTGTEAQVIRDDSFLPAEIRRFALERDFTMVAIAQQELLPGPVPGVWMELRLPPHPIYEAFGAALGIDKIITGATRDMLVIPLEALDVPLPRANPPMLRYYEQQCADLIQQRRTRLGVSGQVRDLLIRQGRFVDQSGVAADLGLSVRTLRRRLADEGTTFRELSTETMGLLAEELLVAGLTVEHVADRLGYASVSAFGAAFRGWKGQSPGHFGRAHRGRPLVRA
ncbi:AraC family transcriptional regulator ligand-binding domain-containing protein [Nocardia sp. NPDC020380]|uniref:AraC family transcriptional regulator n=1 Tax=Nocardia sp. NPDC020380 TaxID=3364309 RepID=UPI003799AB71